MRYKYLAPTVINSGTPEKPFDIVTGYDSIVSFADFFPRYPKIKRCFVITDERVYRNYFPTLRAFLRKCSVLPYSIVLPRDMCKMYPETVKAITNCFFNESFGENDAILAFGGGSVIKISSTVASVYRNGSPFIEFATTLSSLANPCLGGKNRFRMPDKKFADEKFTDPLLVYSDMRYLRTLDREDFSKGMVDILNLSFVNKNVFDALSNHDPDGYMVASIRAKSDISYKGDTDENFDMLDFHFPLTNSICFSNNEIAYRRSVATAMYVILCGCSDMGICPPELSKWIKNMYSGHTVDPLKDLDINSVISGIKPFYNGNVYLPVSPGEVKNFDMPLNDYLSIVKCGFEKVKNT